MDFEQYSSELKKLFIDLCKIPAPTDHEDERISFIANWYADNNLLNFEIDQIGNVVYYFGVKAYNPIHLYTAHVDTVFPMDTSLEPTEKDGILYCPGSGDNTVNLAIMMMTVKLLSEEGFDPPVGVMFAADIGEEGLGNLKGIKSIVSEYGVRIEEVISLDLAYGTIINKAVGSRRYEIDLTTKGGHAFHDFGSSNAIAVAASIIKEIYEQKLPENDAVTTYNVGTIEGGSAINSIAANASFCYEIRSESFENIEAMDSQLHEIVDRNLSEGVKCNIEVIGERPAMGTVDETKSQFLMDRVQSALKTASWQKAGYKDEFNIISGSTDCNIPLSKGIPSVCIGLGYSEGHHSLGEWTRLDSLVPGLETLYELVKN
jgi:acetylornithine deacetylase/succinyl-diaminopimelate desuccinylase-like protein